MLISRLGPSPTWTVDFHDILDASTVTAAEYETGKATKAEYMGGIIFVDSDGISDTNRITHLVCLLALRIST